MAQVRYNHPEIDWQTIETEHFRIHFYTGTEGSAREGITVAEQVYSKVTELYSFEPKNKTDIIFKDTDDISNGAAYYYDNKIVIWTSPLDFELRGSHRWLQNVITHEFTHIVSIQKAMKFGKRFPGAYAQWVGYEKEKRKDVLYGYPNIIVSYPLPGTVVPPWLAEGTAQFMYSDANWDIWDTTRDMILRDRVLNGNLLSWTEINTFGKSGIGNESVYNIGFALCRYIAVKYGPESFKKIMTSLASPLNFSINRAVKHAVGNDGKTVYKNFRNVLENRYDLLTREVRAFERKGRTLESKGSANLFPLWSPDGQKIAFLSNRDHDYFGDTDLYIHNLKTGRSYRISKGVHSKPSWHSGGNILYYSRKAKWPNKQGSKYYDLYEFNLDTKIEARLTVDARAFSPVYIADDSTIVYLATYDGEQNIFKINLKTRTTQRLTDLASRRMISGLVYDPNRKWILFDVTDNHFRNIEYLSLKDSVMGIVLGNPEWDERHPTLQQNGAIVYADDRSGIYNLYYLGKEKQGYITNVSGGAFMPDISMEGRIVYANYENGRYNISILDTLNFIEDNRVGYSPTYFQRNGHLTGPITGQSIVPAVPYEDRFPTMFIMPKLMMDYGTVKTGFYFYSSEILDRLSLIGGASINSQRDLDLFFNFEFRRFFPTLFFETYYLTRNTEEKSAFTVYELDSNLRFQLLQFRGGIKYPLFSTELELFGSWNRYRAFIKEQVVGMPIEGGLAYDYYKGAEVGLVWSLKNVKRRADNNINPSGGYELGMDIAAEQNRFIKGLNLSDAGTLVPNYSNNDLIRIEGSGVYHLEFPSTDRWTLSTSVIFGWISDAKVDSFFYFFGGGMPGLMGYPFYSLGGTQKVIGRLDFRIPLFKGIHIPLGWFTLQNGVLGFILQAGDAWNSELSTPKFKRSLGIQGRFQGFSFYNYPTALGVEIHRGLDKFMLNENGKNLQYGGKNRLYLTILFNF